MNIYEIDQQIASLIDEETGELLDVHAFMDLQMERERKVENMVLWLKNLSAQSAAIKKEIDNLSERKRRADRKCESLKRYIAEILGGERFATAKCSVSYIRRKSLQVQDSANLVSWLEENGHSDLVVRKEPEVSKKSVTDLIKQGTEVPFAELVENTSLVVK